MYCIHCVTLITLPLWSTVISYRKAQIRQTKYLWFFWDSENEVTILSSYSTRMRYIVQFYLTNERERERERENKWNNKKIRTRKRMKSIIYMLREREREYESKERMKKRKRKIRLRKIIIFNLHETTLVHRIKERAIDYLCVIYTYIQYDIYILYIFIDNCATRILFFGYNLWLSDRKMIKKLQECERN